MKSMRFLCFVFAVAHSSARCFADAPVPLAVVHTWGDLQAQKPVVFAHDPSATYRLGIDCADAKLYGGAVLYCLMTGDKPTASTRDGLGPFEVEVQEPANQPRMDVAERLQYMGQQVEKPIAATLYLKTIPFSQAGVYTIRFGGAVGAANDQKTSEVARATVNVSNETGPVWSPWPLNSAGGAVGLLARDNNRSYAAIGVTNPGAGISIPKLPESVGVPAPLPAAKSPLPQLIPSDPDPNIKLQVSGAMLIVTLDQAVQGRWADESFLSRWWINGQPFTPKLHSPAFSMDYGMRHNGAVAMPSAKEIGFQVEFHPELLSAKKGDAIGVQLLLSPEGSEYSGPALNQQLDIGEPEFGEPGLQSRQPRLSNSVTFIYTGDPLRMAPLPLADSLPGEGKEK